MNLKTQLAAALAAGLLMAGGSAAAESAATNYMIEVLPLKKGATIEAAAQYFAEVSPVIASHGIFPVQTYRIVDPQKDGAARIVNVWRVADPQGLEQIFQDPEYLKHVKERDSIFDLPNRAGWMTQEVF